MASKQKVFAVPGVLSIIAGRKKLDNILSVALGTHIFGIVLALAGLGFAASLWSLLNSTCIFFCAGLKVVTGFVTFVFALFGIISVVASIYGCIVICCKPKELAVTGTTTVPANANTAVVASNTQQSQAYGVQQPQPFGVQQPQPYGLQQPQSYGVQQPQPYGVQQPQSYGMQQPQPYGIQQPQPYGVQQQPYGVQQPPPYYDQPGGYAQDQVADQKD